MHNCINEIFICSIAPLFVYLLTLDNDFTLLFISMYLINT